MKKRLQTLDEFINENQLNESFSGLRLIDDDKLYKMVGYNRNPEDWVGSFAHKDAGPALDYILFKLSDYDKKWVKREAKLKRGEAIFRYETEKAKVAKMKPLVKINIEKGLAYFLTEEGIEEEKLEFMKRGVKMLYLNLRRDYYEGRADKSYYIV